ncbi:NAD-dependent epimerase/dehydratase family protein [Phenylobacterium sp.]|uniref:NAD-dependent epimerase/dehydratase family protein n=1 Tax=Phenylobacterium sp. TaxID=1871053 RepID=UPI0039834091
MNRGLAAVTGATGFLGQHVVRALADAGWRVRILARRDPVSLFWSGLTPEVIPGDLGDATALARLCTGADLVVHVAGLISGRRGDLQRVNVEGTRRLAQAVLGAAVPRVLHISSLAARAPHLSAYAASKRAGEDVVEALLGGRVTLVRPPAVYGPGDRETLRLFALAASSPMLPVLDPAARVAVVHVQDAARQIAWLVDFPHVGPFSLSGARPAGYEWRELMQTAATALDRPARLLRIHPVALYGMASLEGIANSWRQRTPVITFGKVRELTYLDWGIRSAERAPGAPAPEFDLLSGFRQTIGWYRSQGWL